MADDAATRAATRGSKMNNYVKRIVALSGGKDSTAMALRLTEVEPADYEFVITPTGNELPDMIEHWRRLGELLGRPLRVLSGEGQSLQGLIRRFGALPNWRMRWCTRILKIEPFQKYVVANQPCITYVGIRADEIDRDGVDHAQLGEVSNRYPLVEWGWGLCDVKDYLLERGVEIPQRTDCAMCFFQTLGEWHRLWQEHPSLYAEAERYEAETGHTLRSPQRDTWPAALKDLRAEFENGRVPRQRASMEARRVMCGTCAR